MNLSYCVKILLSILFLSINIAANADYFVRLNKVVDGDTLDVSLNGKALRVRLIGIDAPEKRENDKALRDSSHNGMDLKTILKLGELSYDFTKQLLSGISQLRLEFDAETYDRYHRLLAYVYLPDGKMLNAEILRAGYANLLTVPPNVRYRDHFRKLVTAARDNSVGLWGQGLK